MEGPHLQSLALSLPLFPSLPCVPCRSDLDCPVLLDQRQGLDGADPPDVARVVAAAQDAQVDELIHGHVETLAIKESEQACHG